MGMYDVLTTGKMIDKLERGEIGECVQGDNKGAKVYYSKAPGAHDKLLVEHSLTHIQEVFNICDYHKKSYWIIKPNYVSFSQAMKAISEGKTVQIHFSENRKLWISKYRQIADLQFISDKVSWSDLVDGNWTIEEESK